MILKCKTWVFNYANVWHFTFGIAMWKGTLRSFPSEHQWPHHPTMTSPSGPNIRAPMTLPQINFKGVLQCLDFGFLKVKNHQLIKSRFVKKTSCFWDFLIKHANFFVNFIVAKNSFKKKKRSQLSSTYRSFLPFPICRDFLRLKRPGWYIDRTVWIKLICFLVSHDRDPISK